MPRLIIIEGIPGSGKTNAAQFIAEWLEAYGFESALYLEGDWSHPADFESFACLNARQFQELKNQFPQYISFLDQQVTVQDSDYFFKYRWIEQEYADQVSSALIRALARYEIYELPIDEFRRLLLQRWRSFANLAYQENRIYVFECCFLQNPLTMYLGRNAESIVASQDFILEIAEIIRHLDPCLVYLNPGDVETTLSRVAKTRPPAWLDFVIAYHTQQGHGKVQGWQGFEGLVKFYEMRQRVELGLLAQLPFPLLKVQHTDWDEDYAYIESFLTSNFHPNSKY
jgi:hypothetical protein